MANAANTVDTLNGYFKESYAAKIKDLVPDGVKLYRMVPFNGRDQAPGNYYHEPLTLGLEHGFSYGGDTGSVFQLNAAVASPNRDATVRGYELVLVSALSVGAASRSVSSKNSFEQATKRIVQNMLKSAQIRIEIQMLYGQVGIAKIQSVNLGTNVITILPSEWAAGIWSGSKNAQLEIRSSAGVLRGTCSVVSPALDTRTVTVDTIPATTTGGANAEDAAADIIWFKGSYQNEFAGLHKFVTNTGTIFNVDASQYELYKGNVINVGAAVGTPDFISFEKVEEAIARAMEKGLIDQDVVCMVNPKHWNKLMTDQAAKRQYDSSYSSAKFEQGAKELVFHGQNGDIKVEASIYVKEGYAYVFPADELERIGSSDITFEQPGMEGKFFRLLDSQNGYEMRLYCDQALFSACIGKFSLLQYIKTF